MPHGSRVVFSSLSSYKELKPNTELFAGCTFAAKFGLAQRPKFFGFKSDTAVLTFSFRFLSSPLLLLFLPYFFFLAGHLVGFILVGKVFGKTFRILGIDQKKGRWLVKQDFYGNFRVNLNVTWFFAIFFGLHD